MTYDIMMFVGTIVVGLLAFFASLYIIAKVGVWIEDKMK